MFYQELAVLNGERKIMGRAKVSRLGKSKSNPAIGTALLEDIFLTHGEIKIHIEKLWVYNNTNMQIRNVKVNRMIDFTCNVKGRLKLPEKKEVYSYYLDKIRIKGVQKIKN